MDKLASKMTAAQRIARQNELDADIKRLDRMRRDAQQEGFQQGRAQVRSLERMMAHPIAQQMLDQAGRELGWMIAAKAEEAGTPGSIALRCAEAVWAYVQKTGAPLEEVIKLEVSYRMDTMSTVMHVDVPAMTFTNEVEDFQMGMYR